MTVLRLLCFGLFLLTHGVAYAQITGKPQAQVAFDVRRLETEHIGPYEVRSRNWDLVDSVIRTLGDSSAHLFFRDSLTSEDKAVRFYALIGLHRLGRSDAFQSGLLNMTDEPVPFQDGCEMKRISFREAVRRATK